VPSELVLALPVTRPAESRKVVVCAAAALDSVSQHEDRSPTHGYAENREAAMDAFAKSWRRQ